MSIYQFQFKEGCGVFGTDSAIANTEEEAKEIIIKRMADRGRTINPNDLIPTDEPDGN